MFTHESESRQTEALDRANENSRQSRNRNKETKLQDANRQRDREKRMKAGELHAAGPNSTGGNKLFLRLSVPVPLVTVAVTIVIRIAVFVVGAAAASHCSTWGRPQTENEKMAEKSKREREPEELLETVARYKVRERERE